MNSTHRITAQLGDLLEKGVEAPAVVTERRLQSRMSLSEIHCYADRI